MKACGLIARLKVLLSVSCLVVSCGKKAENSNQQSDNNQRTKEPVISEMEAHLRRQVVLCEEGVVCPDNIVKIVAFDKKVPKVCTGFLVDESVIATSASCLPELLRLKNQSCGMDVTFFLPQSSHRPAERLECDKVLQVSGLSEDNISLVRDDVAFLRIKGAAKKRRILEIDRAGFENKTGYHVWSVEQQSDKKTAFIRRKTCRAVHGSYVGPFSSKSSSPNMLFSGCALSEADTGSPISDDQGFVRGVVSKAMDPGVRKYLLGSNLLTNGLNQMFHGSNFSCAPTIFDNHVEDYQECIKLMTSEGLKTLRQEMLNREDLYEVARAKLEERINGASQFFNFEVSLKTDGDVRRGEIKPKCFKDVSTWINRINTSRGNYLYKTEFPQIALKRSLGADGHAEMSEEESAAFELSVQFSKTNLKRYRRSHVHYWYDEEGHEIFENVPECR